MDPLRIAIRAIVTFAYLLVMLRITGKKAISQSTAFDFVLSLILGDLVDDFVFAEVTASEFFIAVACLVFADLTVQFIGSRSVSFNYLVNGRPTVILSNGKLQKTKMQRELINRTDVLAFLRIKGSDEQKCDEIKIAVMEDSGEVSVLLKDEYKPIQKKEAEILKSEKK